MKQAEKTKNNHNAVAKALAISVVGERDINLSAPGSLNHPMFFKAAALLFLSGAFAGVLSILESKKIIAMDVKDILIAGYYILCLGGAMALSGHLSKNRLAAMTANTVVFLTFNAIFNDRPKIATSVIALQMWLPLYWMKTDPEAMKEVGLIRKNILENFLVGLAASVALVSYFAWSLKNYGFTFKFDVWMIIMNSAQVFPMYVSIFSMLFMAWKHLKSIGLSPVKILTGLAVLSATLNAPVFSMVGAAAAISPATSAAGFTSITAIMALSTYLTFGKYRSVLPAACFFTAMAALLKITGLT